MLVVGRQERRALLAAALQRALQAKSPKPTHTAIEAIQRAIEGWEFKTRVSTRARSSVCCLLLSPVQSFCTNLLTPPNLASFIPLSRTHTHTHAHAHTRTHAHTHAHTCPHTHTHMHVHARTCTHLQMWKVMGLLKLWLSCWSATWEHEQTAMSLCMFASHMRSHQSTGPRFT